MNEASTIIDFIETLKSGYDRLSLIIFNLFSENSLELIIYNNQQELKLVLNYLERSFHTRLNIKILDNHEEFTQAISIWKFIVKFAEVHNTSLPTSLPKYLASQEAWFQFILVAHVFAYPLDQVL